MTRRRWIADRVEGDRAVLMGAHAVHLARVLRAQAGQQFDVICGDVVRRGTVTTVNLDRVEFALGAAIPGYVAAPITLLLSVFKFDGMEWAIEKCTELNVTSIVPILAGRTEKHLAQAAAKRVERWRRIAHEAAQQSRRAAAPPIADPVKLAGALNPPADVKIVLAETEAVSQLTDVLQYAEPVRSLALAVGPAGGWTAEELELFSQSGWISASLGLTILRAETAAIAALAIARAEIA